MNKKTGSAILLVIVSSIIVTIYSTSVYAEQEHFEYISNEYIQNTKDYYSNELDKKEEVYEQLVQYNRYNEINK